MPTGYTWGIANGETKTFHDFALQCARNFGALVHMRDDSPGLDIRPAEVSPHHAVCISESKAEVVRIGKMTKRQWQAEADAEYANRIAEREARALRNAEQEQRYRNMSAKVREWTPPTEQHEAMKKFMLDQLEQSVNFDCGRDEAASSNDARRTGEQWYWSRISSLSSNIAYHEAALKEDQERVAKANAWVEQLRASLIAGV